MSRTTEEAIFKVTLGDMLRQNSRGNIEIIVIDVMVTIEVGIGQEKGHSHEFIVVIELEVQAVVDLHQDPEPVLIWIG